MAKKTKKQVKEVVKEVETKEESNYVKPTLKQKILEILLYLVSYTITLLLVEGLFKSVTLGEPKIVFAIIATLIIYALNKVVRPILVTLTMPITGITFGLFYVVINCIILKITQLVMFGKLIFPSVLDIKRIWILFLISIILAVLRFLIEDIILKPIVRKAKALKNE